MFTQSELRRPPSTDSLSLPRAPPASLASEVPSFSSRCPSPTSHFRQELCGQPSTDSLPRAPPSSLASEIPSLPQNPPPSLASEASSLRPASSPPTDRRPCELRRQSSTYPLPPNPPPSLVSEASYLPQNPPPSLATGVSSLSPSLPPVYWPMPENLPETLPRDKPPHTILHTILRHTARVSHALMLAIPLALVALVAHVYITAHQGAWRELNSSHNDPQSRAWAPFWLAIAYFLIFVPWWSIVWISNRRDRQGKIPLIFTETQVMGDAFAALLTVIALLWTVYFSLNYELLVVGVPYVTVMMALFGVQLAFLFGTLTSVLYEGWGGKQVAVHRVNHRPDYHEIYPLGPVTIPGVFT